MATGGIAEGGNSALYVVCLYANFNRSDVDVYCQWVEARHIESGILAGLQFRDYPHGDPTQGRPYLVLRRSVRSHTGTAAEAIRRFDEWQRGGEPDATLLQ